MKPSKIIFILLAIIVVMRAIFDIVVFYNRATNHQFDNNGVKIEITVSESWYIQLPGKFLSEM